MSREIVKPKIGFYLYNHSGGTMVDQNATQEMAGYFDSRLLVKRERNLLRGSQQGFMIPGICSVFAECFSAVAGFQRLSQSTVEQ
jgi:hypothetical protein